MLYMNDIGLTPPASSRGFWNPIRLAEAIF
jgi:hypothetical protein